MKTYVEIEPDPGSVACRQISCPALDLPQPVGGTSSTAICSGLPPPTWPGEPHWRTLVTKRAPIFGRRAEGRRSGRRQQARTRPARLRGVDHEPSGNHGAVPRR